MNGKPISIIKSEIESPPNISKTDIIKIFINWNEADQTIKCIDDSRNKAHFRYTTIIIDNNSSDNSIDKIIAHLTINLELKREPIQEFKVNGQFQALVHPFAGKADIVLIETKKNLGVSGAWNIGIRWALLNRTPNYIFILDNESQLESNAIDICFYLARKTNASVVGCLIKNMDGSIQFHGIWIVPNLFYFDQVIKKSPLSSSQSFWDVDFISACGVLISREVLELVDKKRGCYFNSNFFYLAEDQEFSSIVKQLGHRTIIAREAVAYHKINRKKVGLDTAYYYSSRNRIYLANAFLSWPWKVLFHIYYPLYRFTRALYLLIKGDRKVAFAHIQGLLDGYRKKGGKWAKQGTQTTK